MPTSSVRRLFLLQAAHESDGGTAAAWRAEAGVLDAAALGRLTELDPSGQGRLLARVFAAYQNSAARLMPQFHAARRAGNLKVVGDVAHTLKSSSASIGGLKLAALCGEVETLIRDRPDDALDSLEARLDALCAELAVVLAAVAAMASAGTARGKP